MGWIYNGYGWTIEINDDFGDSWYRATDAEEPVATRPLPIMDGSEFWMYQHFQYKSNMEWLCVLYMWVENGHQGGYANAVKLPARSYWTSANIITRKYGYDPGSLPHNRLIDCTRLMLLGFDSEFGYTWDVNNTASHIAQNGDADVYLNITLPSYQLAEPVSYSKKARR